MIWDSGEPPLASLNNTELVAPEIEFSLHRSGPQYPHAKVPSPQELAQLRLLTGHMPAMLIPNKPRLSASTTISLLSQRNRGVKSIHLTVRTIEGATVAVPRKEQRHNASNAELAEVIKKLIIFLRQEATRRSNSAVCNYTDFICFPPKSSILAAHAVNWISLQEEKKQAPIKSKRKFWRLSLVHGTTENGNSGCLQLSEHAPNYWSGSTVLRYLPAQHQKNPPPPRHLGNLTSSVQTVFIPSTVCGWLSHGNWGIKTS